MRLCNLGSVDSLLYVGATGAGETHEQIIGERCSASCRKVLTGKHAQG